MCAQISEIIGTDEHAFICVDLMDFGSKHAILDMPTVSRRTHSTVLKPEDIICAINLQHDCSRGHCMHNRPQDIYQEREKITRQRMAVSHSDNTHYILNMQSLHNYKALSQLVPPHLRGYSYKVADEVQLRHEAADSIRRKHKDQAQAKQDLLVANIADRAHAHTNSNDEPASGADLLNSLDNDADLIDVFQSVLQRVDAFVDPTPLIRADTNTLPSQPDSLSPPTSIPPAGVPVFSTTTQSKAKGKKKEPVVPSTLYVYSFSSRNLY